MRTAATTAPSTADHPGTPRTTAAAVTPTASSNAGREKRNERSVDRLWALTTPGHGSVCPRLSRGGPAGRRRESSSATARARLARELRAAAGHALRVEPVAAREVEHEHLGAEPPASLCSRSRTSSSIPARATSAEAPSDPASTSAVSGRRPVFSPFGHSAHASPPRLGGVAHGLRHVRKSLDEPRVPRAGPGLCTPRASERRKHGSSTHGT
jgi:hypothetical protein